MPTREQQLKALRDINTTIEAILSMEPADLDEARILDSLRTVDLLCRAQLPDKFKHRIVHLARPGDERLAACGHWGAYHLETTQQRAEVTCKRCAKAR